MANKLKSINATDLGPLNYRQLQEANREDFESLSPEFKDTVLKIKQQYAPVSLYDTQANAEELVQSPLADTKTPWGESIWDNKTATPEQFNHLGDTRANNQWTIAKWGSALGSAVTLAGTTFLDGTVGLLYGIGTAIAEGRWSGLWDNAVSNGLQEVNRYVQNDLLPFYKTEASQHRPWWENLGSVDFWADGVLKNMGFMVGALYSGSIFTKALKLIPLLKNSALGAKTVGSFLSAVNEGRVEANNNSYEMVTSGTKVLQQGREDAISDIMNNKDLTAGQKQDLITGINQNYQNEVAKLGEDARKMGTLDMALNVPFLMLDNLFTFGKFYAKGFSTAKQTVGKGVRESAEEAYRKSMNPLTRVVRTAEEGAKKYSWKDISTGKAVAKGLAKGVVEGNEEMGQAFISEFATNLYSDSPDTYYKAVSNPKTEREVRDGMESAIKAFADTYGNADRYEEFALGAITGLLGAPSFGRNQNADANTWLGRGKRFGISGGLLGELASARETNKRGQEQVSWMNKLADRLDKDKKSLMMAKEFNDAMAGWSAADNKFEYHNQNDNDIWRMVNAFLSTGRKEDLLAMADMDVDHMSDEELDQIAKLTSPEQFGVRTDGTIKNTSGWRDSNGNYLSESEKGLADMRHALKKKQYEFKRDIDNYEKALNEVRGISNNDVNQSEDEISELAWLRWKVKKFEGRARSIKEEDADNFSIIDQALERFQDLLGVLNEDDEIDEKWDNDPMMNYASEFIKSKREATDKNHLAYIQSIRDVLSLTHNTSKNDMPNLGVMIEGIDDFLDNMANSKYLYNNLIRDRSDMSQEEFRQTIQDIKDLGKINSARKSFMDRYNEYVKNPNKQKENRKKIDKQREKKETAINKAQRKTNAMSKTREQLVEMSIEELNSQKEALADSKAAYAEEALATMEDVIKTKQYADAALRNVEKALAQKRIEPEMYDKYVDVINKAVKTAPSAEEFKAPDAFAFMAFADGIPMEEEQIAQMREFVEEAVKNVDDVPSGEGVSQAEIDEAVNNESKGRTTGHDSVSAAETTDETRKKKAAEAKKEKEKKEKDSKRQQAIDNTMPALNSFIFSLGQKGIDLPDNTEALIKDVIGDVYDHITEDGLDDIKDIQDVLIHDLSYQKLNKVLLGDTGTVPMVSVIQKMLELLNGNKAGTEQAKGNDTEQARSNSTEEVESNTEEVELTEQELEEINSNPQKNTESNPNPANYAETVSKKNSEIAASWRPEIDEYANERFDNYKGLVPIPFHETKDAKKFWGKDYKKKRAATKAVYDYLKENHAFENASTVEKKSRVYFVVDPKLNRQVAEATGDKDAFVILMSKDPKGRAIIGSLPTSYTQAFKKNNVNYMYARTIKAYNEWNKTDHEPDAKFVSNEISYILKDLPGGVLFTNSKSEATDHTLNQVFYQDLHSPQGFELVIVKKDGSKFKYYLGGNEAPYNIRGESLGENSKGNIYVLVPYKHGSNVRFAVPFILEKYNVKARDSVLGKYIEQVLKKSVAGKDIHTKEAQITLKTALNEVFTGPFRVNVGNGVLTVRKINREPEKNGKHKSVEVFRLEHPDDTNKLIDTLLEEFAKNLTASIRVNLNHINKKVDFNGEQVPYNNLIGTLAHNNLAVSNTVNNWFTVAPLSRDGEIEIPEKDTVASAAVTQNETENTVTHNGNTYYVNKEGVIFDKNHNVVKGLSGKDIMLILAKDEIETNQYPIQAGYPTSGVYILNDGSLYDSNKEELIIDPQKVEETKKKLREKYNKKRDKKLPKELPIPEVEEDTTDNTVSTDEDTFAKLFTSINNKDIMKLYNLLTDEQKEIFKKLDDKSKRNLTDTLTAAIKKNKANRKKRVNLEQIQKIFDSASKFREKVSDSYKPINIAKEKKWLNRVLPQLSNSEHLRIVKGLIKMARGKNAGLAFGKFQGGMMTISDEGARGTVYHEAFHAVVATLLNRKERTELFTAGSAKYGIDPFERDADLEIEENLAEDFRRYVQRGQIPLLGKAIRFFKSMKHIIQSWAGNEPYIQNLFYRINSGLMADNSINTAVSAEDIVNAQQEVVNLYMSDINGKELTEEQIADINDRLQDISDSIGDVPWHLAEGKFNTWYVAGYNGQSVTAEDYSSPVLKAVNENEDNETVEPDNDVAEYYNRRYAFENLSEDQSYILERNDVSRDDYNTLTLTEKQGLFRCMV